MTAAYEPRNKDFISFDVAMRVAASAAGRAHDQGLDAAMCGGAATGYYGSDRSTKDVDFVASGFLGDAVADGQITFGGQPGGEVYLISGFAPKPVPLDWIRRNDDEKPLYDAALADRARTSGFGPNLFIVRPEYLVLMKIIAGRSKDHQDVVFLLRQRDLTDRTMLRHFARSVFGRTGAVPLIHDIEAFEFEADLADHKDKGGA